MNRVEANELLEKGAELIDITPTMHNDAVGHYDAVGSFLMNNGIEADVSPCGSVAMGTPTRPLPNDDEDYFDIDVIVKRTDLNKDDCVPSDVRKPVEDILVSSDRYGNKVENCDECITLKFVLNGKEGGFRLDLDTCVSDADSVKAMTAPEGEKYSRSAVAIARKTSTDWLDSNPQGLCEWFNEKNERLALPGRHSRKTILAHNNPLVYASVDQVPDMMDRSSLQRAVQVAKRSRDEYYRRCGAEKIPASCVLTVLFGRLSARLPESASTLDILEAFTDCLVDIKGALEYGADCLIGTRGAWRLDNPVYEENMLDDWDDEDAARFCAWADELRCNINDLIEGGQRQATAKDAIFGSKTGRLLAVGESFAAAATDSAALKVSPRKPWARM